MLKVDVSGPDSKNKKAFELSQSGDQLLIDGEVFNGDLIRLSDRHFHLIWQHRSYEIHVLDYEPGEKTGKILVNGHILQTQARSSLDLLLQAMGMQAGSTKKLNVLRAPMPGLIQSVTIAEGDEVAAGDNLLILVAMKMENALKASGTGTVKSIKVLPGEIVEKNQVLMEFH